MTDTSAQSGVEGILAHAAKLKQTGELKHAGVKGMRWGFRKKEGGGYKQVGRTKGSPDHDRSREIRSKRVSDMSNDELQAVNKRLQLERTYRDLNPSVIRRGQGLVTRALSVAESVDKAETFYRSEQGQRIRRTIGMSKKK